MVVLLLLQLLLLVENVLTVNETSGSSSGSSSYHHLTPQLPRQPPVHPKAPSTRKILPLVTVYQGLPFTDSLVYRLPCLNDICTNSDCGNNRYLYVGAMQCM